jgi:hypothetical protein
VESLLTVVPLVVVESTLPIKVELTVSAVFTAEAAPKCCERRLNI